MTNGEPYLGVNATPVPISNSEIQVFKDCRRKWWLQYYRGLHRKAISGVGPLPLGTRVHAALEQYHRDNRDPVEAYLELLEQDKILFDANHGTELSLAKEGLPEDSEDSDDELLDKVTKKFISEGEMGRIMIEGYLEWLEETGMEAEYEIIDVEQANRYLLMDGRVELIGKMDIRLHGINDDTTYIGDIKTAAQFALYDNTAHMSEQLMLYTMLERLSNTGNATADGGVYIVLKKVKRTATAKPPFYKRYVIRFNEATLQAFWTRLHGELRDILSVRDALDSGADHKYVAYPSPSGDCVWKCPFFSVCPMFDDGSSAEMWLNEYAEVGDPYARYEDVASA